MQVLATSAPNFVYVSDTDQDSFTSIEHVTGSAFDDTIASWSEDRVIMEGGAGNDNLSSDEGGDSLIGGEGVDGLDGYHGADVFYFFHNGVVDSGIGQDNRDIVNDFSRDEGDKINVHNPLFTFSFIGDAPFSGGYQIRYDFDGDNLILQLDTDADGTADMEIDFTAGVHPTPLFLASDFIL